MGTLSFEPLIPLPLWLALAVAGAGLLGWYAYGRPGALPPRRWAGVLALMGCGLLLVLGILLNPTWIEPATPPAGKPLLTILLDTSASMATPDAAQGRSRYQAATAVVQAFAQSMGERYDVRVLGFTDA